MDFVYMLLLYTIKAKLFGRAQLVSCFCFHVFYYIICVFVLIGITSDKKSYGRQRSSRSCI